MAQRPGAHAVSWAAPPRPPPRHRECNRLYVCVLLLWVCRCAASRSAAAAACLCVFTMCVLCLSLSVSVVVEPGPSLARGRPRIVALAFPATCIPFVFLLDCTIGGPCAPATIMASHRRAVYARIMVLYASPCLPGVNAMNIETDEEVVVSSKGVREQKASELSKTKEVKCREHTSAYYTQNSLVYLPLGPCPS